jgi:hypothetical protein
VEIFYNENTFTIIEYLPLGLNDKTSYYPLEQQKISFYDNGYYKIEAEMLFEPPQYNRKVLHHIYNSNLSLLNKLTKGLELSDREKIDLENLASTFMICYLNGFDDAKQKLIEAKSLIKSYNNNLAYTNFKEVMRVLRKIKYGGK